MAALSFLLEVVPWSALVAAILETGETLNGNLVVSIGSGGGCITLVVGESDFEILGAHLVEFSSLVSRSREKWLTGDSNGESQGRGTLQGGGASCVESVTQGVQERSIFIQVENGGHRGKVAVRTQLFRALRLHAGNVSVIHSRHHVVRETLSTSERVGTQPTALSTFLAFSLRIKILGGLKHLPFVKGHVLLTLEALFRSNGLLNKTSCLALEVETERHTLLSTTQVTRITI